MDIREIKRIEVRTEESEEMVVIKVEREKQKRNCMRKKRNLKEKTERILDDWTWKERKIK